MKREDLTVGQDVVLSNVNWKGSERGTVIRVGRKLVTIRSEYGHEAVYRIESQQSNDECQHGWFLTLGQQAEMDRRTEDRGVLHKHGLTLADRSMSSEKLHAIAEFLRGSS